MKYIVIGFILLVIVTNIALCKASSRADKQMEAVKHEGLFK